MNGPLPSWLAPITVPASWAYGAVMERRNARFDRGIGVERLDRPVISVGNITTGGTGKTPMVMWLARQLCAGGHHPLIAMRGYKASPGQPSDEQAEYADLIPEVPVVADPHRIAAVRQHLLQRPEVDVIILDDGFQHRSVHRDLDLVLVDAQAETVRQRLLPAGHLREPLHNLHRATAVVITRAHHEDPELTNHIVAHHGRPPVAWSSHRWTRLDIHHGETARHSREVDWLKGKNVCTMMGIGHPQSVVRQVESVGATVVHDLPVQDHVSYRRDTVERLQARLNVKPRAGGFDALFVTHKDWVKIRSLIDWKTWTVPFVVPRLEIDVFRGGDELLAMVCSVFERPVASPT